MEFEFAEHDRAAGEAFMRLGAAVDEFEGYARPHALRVAKLSDALAARFRLSRADRSALVFAALLHDLGELAMKERRACSSSSRLRSLIWLRTSTFSMTFRSSR